MECQSYQLAMEDPVTVEYITRYVATLKQKYTQSNGRRPFGISSLIVGFDYDGTPRLYQTDPSGTYHAWKVKCVFILFNRIPNQTKIDCTLILQCEVSIYFQVL